MISVGPIKMPNFASGKDHNRRINPLYSKEERERRDKTPWTLIQGVLAPTQFVVFLISSVLVVNYFINGSGQEAAILSVVVKTLILYLIMITGSIWEKIVFGKFLFAKPFFWEDVFSILVLFLHTAYIVSLIIPGITVDQQLYIAIFAYLAYLINAAQFLFKFRQASCQAKFYNEEAL